MASQSKSSVLVTGASTGIGRATVAKLMEQGHNVWATVRRQIDADSLYDEFGSGLHVLHVDITDDAAVEAAAQEVLSAGPLNGLVNNAGGALPGPLEYTDVSRFRQQLEVNLVGHFNVTKALLPALREARAQQQRARIIMIGSIGGRIAMPILGPYHASKFAMVGLTDSLRAELAPAGIDVILLEPGTVKTAIWGASLVSVADVTNILPEHAQSFYAKQLKRFDSNSRRSERTGLSPEKVADQIVKELTAHRPSGRRLVGAEAHAIGVLARLPFAWQYAVMAGRA